jgi:hypothetical protein
MENEEARDVQPGQEMENLPVTAINGKEKKDEHFLKKLAKVRKFRKTEKPRNHG